VFEGHSLKARYIIYEINHTILLIDITGISLPTEIFPPEGKTEGLVSRRFQAWPDAERFLAKCGASRDSLEKARLTLDRNSFAVINI
jgi:hypothetical protein